MHIVITTTDYPHIDRIFQYCDSRGITMYYGCVDADSDHVSWQIIHEASAHIDILLMLFPEHLQVLHSGP